jgi:hypothetical protein
VDVRERILDDAGSQSIGRGRETVAECPQRIRVGGQRVAAGGEAVGDR